MRAQVTGQYNPFREALYLLQQSVKEDPFKEMEGRTLSDEALEKISFVENAIQNTKMMLTESYCLEDARLYFKPHGKDCGSLFLILLLCDDYSIMDIPSLEEWRRSLDNMEKPKFYEELGRKVFCYNQSVNDSTNMTVCHSMEDVLRLILLMDITSEEKVMLQDIVLNRASHLERLFPILETSLDVVEKCKSRMEQYANSFESYWTQKLGSQEVLSYMDSCGIGFKLNMDANPMGTLLRPAIFNPGLISYAISMDEHTGEYTHADLATFGILFDDTFTLSDSSYFTSSCMSESDALKIFKLLSDKSKFAILGLAHTNAVYGAQIAEHLGLTTATVSYHTSELVSAGLLQMEKKGNRIYYSLNKASIQALETFIGKSLL